MRWQAHLRAAAVMSACAALAGCGSSSSEVSNTGGSAPTSASSAAAPTTAAPTGPTASQPPTTGTGASTAASPSQTGGTAAGGGGGTGSARRTCSSVAFAPASSHGAFEITATGPGCPTAQGVASVAQSCFGCDYRAAGFSCRGRKITTGLIRIAYTCTNGAARITFVRG